MTFESSKKANKALVKLTEITDYCGTATISDLYEAAGKENKKPNTTHGWEANDINRAYIEPFNGKHVLRFPEPHKID